MQVFKKLGSFSILAASLSGAALADPELGDWSSEGGDFAAGEWVEQFTGGDIGAVGNIFSAGGLDACCFDLTDAELTGAEITGDNEYLVIYEGAVLTLPNTDDLPWYSAGDGTTPYMIESLVLVMKLAVTVEGDDITQVRFDVTGSGAPTGYSDIRVSFSAHYEGLPTALSEEPGLPAVKNGLQGLLNGANISITRTSVARFDIKPWSCTNPFNVKARGVMPAVIAGSDTQNVTTIDAASIRLAGVAPVRSAIGDILSADPEAPCDEPEPDGIDDLVIKFDVQELTDAIGGHELEHGSEVILPLNATIGDVDEITSEDVIWIINKSRKPAKGKGQGNGGVPTEPGNQGNGKGWGPDNNPSKERSNSKSGDGD